MTASRQGFHGASVRAGRQMVVRFRTVGGIPFVGVPSTLPRGLSTESLTLRGGLAREEANMHVTSWIRFAPRVQWAAM
ncbi:MAG: hypothetical protein AB7I09_16360, partial [Planctomycetota bacterium]